MEDAIAQCGDILEELCDFAAHLDTPLAFKQIPVAFYKEFLKAELRGAVQGQTFSGMRDSGPEPHQEALFNTKVRQLQWLLNNCGLISGHFERFIKNGATCQNLESPRRAPASTPKIRAKPAAPAPPHQHQEEEEQAGRGGGATRGRATRGGAGGPSPSSSQNG